MAITPLGNEYKGLEFDGVSSKTYGVMIYGEGVFNAPERDVEMIKIPGRSGTFALDKGRFENIEVTYPARLIADNTADFASAISDFRNALCSRKGYVRLTDDYHPDEYRMAIYKEGLEVDEQVLRAGEFDIKFDCKPQRWLTSGETAVSVTSGDTISNPTLFEASPLLEVEGYGDININDSTITIENIPLGNTSLRAAFATTTKYIGGTNTLDLNVSELNTGDEIYFPEVKIVTNYDTTPQGKTINRIEVDNQSNIQSTVISVLSSTNGSVEYTLPSAIFYYGTSATTVTSGAKEYLYRSDGSSLSGTWSMYAEYDGDRTITIKTAGLSIAVTSFVGSKLTVPEIIGNSTKSALGNPTYIDLDLGEAWNNNNGSIVSVNNAVNLPALLPTLAVGSSEITFDNTITDLKVTPRWWKV